MTPISSVISDKRRWRAYRARARQLPEPYRTAVRGVERYLLHTGPGDGEGVPRMLEDLADLFEQAAADSIPIRQLLGDPVDFADQFKSLYGPGSWLAKEQRRLRRTVARAERW